MKRPFERIKLAFRALTERLDGEVNGSIVDELDLAVIKPKDIVKVNSHEEEFRHMDYRFGKERCQCGNHWLPVAHYSAPVEENPDEECLSVTVVGCISCKKGTFFVYRHPWLSEQQKEET